MPALGPRWPLLAGQLHAGEPDPEESLGLAAISRPPADLEDATPHKDGAAALVLRQKTIPVSTPTSGVFTEHAPPPPPPCRARCPSATAPPTPAAARSGAKTPGSSTPGHRARPPPGSHERGRGERRGEDLDDEDTRTTTIGGRRWPPQSPPAGGGGGGRRALDWRCGRWRLGLEVSRLQPLTLISHGYGLKP